MPGPVIISAAVEGIVDEAVVKKLIMLTGGCPGPVYRQNGKSSLRQKIGGYNNAAHHAPWIVLVDLDREPECAPMLCQSWIPRPAPHLCFRVAVREVEAWLIADSQTLASFLRVPLSQIPSHPETLDHPKRTIVNLVRQSRRQVIRKDMVPREGSGRPIGPAYTSRLIEYIEKRWRPDVAAQQSESLRGAIACLKRLVGASA